MSEPKLTGRADEGGRRSGSASASQHGPTCQREAGDERGQTTVDFAIGASILLLSVAFVLAAVPTFVPSGDGRGTERSTGDRLADHLVRDRLVDPDATGQRDQRATDAFFAADGDLGDEVGVGPGTNVNVTLTPLEEGAAAQVRGPPVPDGGRVAHSRRLTVREGDNRWLSVTVWTDG